MSGAAASRHVEVAVVGGGPAGAAAAIQLAAAGHEVALFERLPRPRWRASGVYSSPLTRRRLAQLGLSSSQLDALIRPISAMVVETADGRARCTLAYDAPQRACGVDRVRLEEALLDRARAVGVEVREGAAVREVILGSGRQMLVVSDEGGPARWITRLVVGADGPSSMIARAAGASLPSRRFRRAALTGHRLDPSAAASAGDAMHATMIIGDGWYLGVAPVPGGRSNLGLVLGEADLRRRLAQGAGLGGVLDDALAQVAGPARRLHGAPPTDAVQAHLPLAHRVRRASGPGFVLVGDAAGFIDPLTGEGLHRSLVTADMAAAAIADWAAGDRSALSDYDRRLRARFRSKDVVSWLLQFFAANPFLAAYALRRLARRNGERRLLAARLADMGPASALLDPRYLVRLLAP